MDSFIATLSLASLAVLVGVELAVAVFLHPIVNRMHPESAASGRAMSARRLGAVMPWWYAATSLAVVLTAVLAWRSGGPVALWAFCAGTLVLVVVVSVTVLVPLNSSIARRSDHDADGGTGGDIRTWDRWHAVRTCLLGCGLAVGAVAVSV